MVEVIVWTYIVLVVCQGVLQCFTYMNSFKLIKFYLISYRVIMSITYKCVYIYILNI